MQENYDFEDAQSSIVRIQTTSAIFYLLIGEYEASVTNVFLSLEKMPLTYEKTCITILSLLTI